LAFSGYVKDPELAKGDLFPDKMNVEFHMLRPSMMHRVLGEVHGGDIVVVDDRGLIDVDVQLAEKIAKPAALGGRVRHRAVLSFGA
jgi:hypothetical protein